MAITISLLRDDSVEADLNLLVSVDVDIARVLKNNNSKPNLI